MMQRGHHVRIGDATDAEELAGLQLRTALHAYGEIFPPEAPAPTVDELRAGWDHWLAATPDPAPRVFVVDGGSGPIGVVACGADPDEPAAGHMARLYVDPVRWGDGIGGVLQAAAVAHLVAASFDRATLWVLERNERARRWYERLGWSTTGESRPIYEPAGIIDLRYQLQLDGRSPRRG